MAEQVFYMRGFPGSGRLGGSQPQMLADLALIADLSIDQIKGISDSLSRASGFLDTRALRTLIREHLPEQKAVRAAVVRALQSLEPDDLDALLDRVESEGETNKAPLDAVKLKSLHRNLPALIKVYPALARFEKAQRLVRVTGQRLESIDLICDLRPIFDNSGERVEGIFPYTRLRLVATGADGLPRDFEAELTAVQVYQLFENAKKAKIKLETLQTKLEDWLPGGVPELPEIRLPEEDAGA